MIDSAALSHDDIEALAAIASACPPPAAEHETASFWRAGASGALSILRCSACRHWIHPPSPVCPECLGREVAFEAVSGLGRILSYTHNHQRWYPGLPASYTIVVVELEEQQGLRLVSNLVGQAGQAGEPAIGDAVEVVFWRRSPDVAVPVFRPVPR